MLPEQIDLEASVTQIKEYLQNLQGYICQLLIAEDISTIFTEDFWQHAEGGGGKTCLLTHGAVLEKVGVNFSHVYGKSLPLAATINRPAMLNASFQALGVSVVIHPRNPYVPTAHANIRFIAVQLPENKLYWWFGGGFDLTPYYGFIEDCQHWHHMARAACQAFGADVYPAFKKACDEYFYLPHRQEPRGIGGLFFDDLYQWQFNKSFAFVRSVGDHFMQAYQPILQRRKNYSFGEDELAFQAYRRGRYVEFNLLYDRGTLFGLQSGGRVESILMSLPPLAHWCYNWQPAQHSVEEQFYQNFLVRREWV